MGTPESNHEHQWLGKMPHIHYTEYTYYTHLLIFNAFCRIDKSAVLCSALLTSYAQWYVSAYIISITITNRPIWIFVYFMCLIWIDGEMVSLWFAKWFFDALLSLTSLFFCVNEAHSHILLVFGHESRSWLKSNQAVGKLIEVKSKLIGDIFTGRFLFSVCSMRVLVRRLYVTCDKWQLLMLE